MEGLGSVGLQFGWVGLFEWVCYKILQFGWLSYSTVTLTRASLQGLHLLVRKDRVMNIVFLSMSCPFVTYVIASADLFLKVRWYWSVFLSLFLTSEFCIFWNSRSIFHVKSRRNGTRLFSFLLFWNGARMFSLLYDSD